MKKVLKSRFGKGILLLFILCTNVVHAQVSTPPDSMAEFSSAAKIDTVVLPTFNGRLTCPIFGDIDGDGLVDFISGSQAGALFFYKNTGTSTDPTWFRTALYSLDTILIGGLISNEVRPQLVDIDNDGDLDLFVGRRYDYGSFQMDDIGFYRNTGTATNPIFTNDQANIPGIQNQDLGVFSNFNFADLDGDGDLDMLSLGSDYASYLENIGTVTSPSFSRKIGAQNPFDTWAFPNTLIPGNDFIDFDNDGDLDLFLVEDGGQVKFVENIGTASSMNFDIASGLQTPNIGGLDIFDVGQFGTINFEDVTGDGVADAILGSFKPGQFRFLKGIQNGPQVSITQSNISCNGLTDGSATATASGIAPFFYSWSTGDTLTSSGASTISSLMPGTYTVTVTENGGVTITDSITIAEPAVLMGASIVDSNVSCNGSSDGGATASAIGGTAPYTYVWSNSATTASITGVESDTYYVTITDNNGCTALDSVTITQPLILVGSTVVDSNASCSGLNGGATVSATGGTAPYTYLWSNSATTASITGVGAGSYNVFVTDANGCLDTVSVTIAELTSLVASSVVDSNVICNGLFNGGATASATGGTAPYTYAWSNSAITASITGVGAGTYNVFITDASGCTDSASVTITEPAILVASSVVDSNVSCNGLVDGGATASATGGTAPYTYLWSNSATTASITGVVSGTYNVFITDVNGCTDSASVTITEPAVLVATAIADSNVSCNGTFNGGATAAATGGTAPYTYAWSNGATTASITGIESGTYNIFITDVNGCTDSASVTITEPAVLVATAIADSNVSCNGTFNGGATAAATGGTAPYTYAWSNGATTASITGIESGTYNIFITDANGCTDSASVTITEPAVLNATSVVDSNVSCNGTYNGGATASATGGTAPYTYAWSNSATTASITGVVAGTYTVTITDASGCYDTTSVTITEPALLVVASVVDSNVTCNGIYNGGATVSATGGTAPYTYAWSNSATTASITGVGAGMYNIFITDANGCTDSASVTITEPALLVASSVVDSNVSCNGFTNGGATASAIGGTPPYTYVWSNSATTASITGVVAGTYNVFVTDANGCTSQDSIEITEPEISASIDTVIAFGAYDWIDGVTYTETTYGPTHILTDRNGCDSTVTLNFLLVNYCDLKSTRNRFEWIKEIEIGDDIDNLTNQDGNGYGDYTDQILIVDTGDVVDVTLIPGYRRRQYVEFWRIWADWNYDGDFDDLGEKVFEQKGKNVQTGSFTVPTNVSTHDLRLRVAMRWKRYSASCGSYRNGEVEEYTIRVNGAQGYSAPNVKLDNEDYEMASGQAYEFSELYPNPVSSGGYISGYIRVEETGIKQFNIVNTLGQLVKTEFIDCLEEENRFEISTEDLNKGMYFINIEGGLETSKIIIQ